MTAANHWQGCTDTTTRPDERNRDRCTTCGCLTRKDTTDANT